MPHKFTKCHRGRYMIHMSIKSNDDGPAKEETV
ncbi:uncharacterized protein G2W53_001539 [Senna tora]|uniref:Uncharacterized protein n=1 Tax=Senna tora TaxID=362788 RepID=A0A835CJJ1_9FABA|nr:uncharacterized protein G2W53_001539 [Senna tora]